MKKIITLLLASVALFSCASNIQPPSKSSLTKAVTAENYETFFNVSSVFSSKKTEVRPTFNKHIKYINVVLHFKTTGNSKTSYGNNQTITHDFYVYIDETGYGSATCLKSYDALYSYSIELVESQGTVSFAEDYTTFDWIENVKRDSAHKENFGVYLNLYGGGTYALRFKADYNIKETADTDAFYLIESVKVKFTATLNNSTKEFEFDMKPNLYGIAEITTNDEYSSISGFSFTYTNGYYLSY